MLDFKRSHPSWGFTLVELILAIVLSGMIVTVFVSTLMSMFRTSVVQKAQLELGQENQLALSIIERDIRLATAFDTAPAYTPFVDYYGANGTNENATPIAWSYKGTDADHRVLILRQIATSTPPFVTARTPVYVQGSVTSPYATANTGLNCTLYDKVSSPAGTLSYNPKLPYYLIYFVRSGVLYRRTLTDVTTARCNSMAQYQKQSCPGVDASRPASCLVNDEKIVDNVTSFSALYYKTTYDSISGAATATDIDAYNQTDAKALTDITNALVTLRLDQKVNGKTRTSKLSIRVGRVN